jgi:hypothetical protein
MKPCWFVEHQGKPSVLRSTTLRELRVADLEGFVFVEHEGKPGLLGSTRIRKVDFFDLDNPAQDSQPAAVDMQTHPAGPVVAHTEPDAASIAIPAEGGVGNV